MEHHVGFSVADLDMIIHFYKDILGFIVLDLGVREGTEAAAPLGLFYVKYRIWRVILPKGDFFLQFLQFEDLSQQKQKNISHFQLGFNHVGIEVDDVDEIYQRLKKHDIQFESRPVIMKESGVKFFYVRDPEDNMIEFVQFPEKTKKAIEKQVDQLRKAMNNP